MWKVDGENLRNTNAGGVVIGSGIKQIPAGYKLYVAEGVLTEKVKVAVKSTDEWSDKVFASDYKLRSLPDLDRYIHKNHHLPGVPSAEEVVKKGIDLGQMDAQLLEKVEELTLYVIALKRDNEAIRKQLAKLKNQRARKTSH